MAFTRRTHIVRCAADPKDPDSLYADVEVLDALAFRTPGGKELVLTFDQKNVDPYIIDEVSGKNKKTPNNGTRRSHMERVKSKDGGLIDVEVIDAVAFRGPGNKEWILNLPSKKSSEFSANDKSNGSAPFTRRTHTEKISEGFEKKPTAYMTVTRTDEVAFRTVMGEEMIIKMPSCDDPNSSEPRADTFIVSPKGYDPKREDGPKPPLNKDKNVYVSFPEGANLFTGDEKVSQGMMWWIRKISGAELLFIRVKMERTNVAVPVTIQTNFQFSGDDVDDGVPLHVDTIDLDPDIMSPDKVDASHPAQKLNFKDVNMWGSKYTNNRSSGPNPDHVEAGGELNWTALFWVNVGKVKKEHGEVKLYFEIGRIDKPAPNGPSGSLSFIWAVSGGNQFVTVPIHPRPDATNAFGPYPFGDTDAPTYIGLWNTGPFNSSVFTKFGVAVPPNPDAGIGWTNPADAAAFASALNAVGVADAAAAEAIRIGNELNIAPGPPPTVFTSFTIEFAPGDPLKDGACLLTVDAWRFNGKTNFPYDEDNTIDFVKPTGEGKTKTKTLTSNAPSAPKAIQVTLDDNGLIVE